MISVLLPVRNAAKTLPAALDSLLAQTFRDFEIIAVDDGSTDHETGDPSTREILVRYAEKDDRIKPVFREHSGIARSLNAAMELAQGEYLARMDADDLCHQERFALQSAHLDGHPETDLVSCRVHFGGDPAAAAGYKRYIDWTNSLLRRHEISNGRFRESPLAHPTVMFRRETVRRLGGYADGPFPEDYELWLRWLEGGARMEKLPASLLTWNDPPDRLSRTHSNYDPVNFHKIKAGYLARWLAANNPHHPEVFVAGGGRTTRKRAETLLAHGVKILGWLDIDPKKIGKIVAGRPVLHHDDVPGPGDCFVVSYLASHGAAEYIAAFLESRGFVQAKSYILAA